MLYTLATTRPETQRGRIWRQWTREVVGGLSMMALIRWHHRIQPTASIPLARLAARKAHGRDQPTELIAADINLGQRRQCARGGERGR